MTDTTCAPRTSHLAPSPPALTAAALTRPQADGFDEAHVGAKFDPDNDTWPTSGCGEAAARTRQAEGRR